MDEFTAVMRARDFVRKVNRDDIPAPVEAYIKQIDGIFRLETDLAADEPGYSFEVNGKYYVCVNADDQLTRQRFTACHELAHIVLGLPSEHGAAPWWSYAKRSPNEICCDVFAAELLLPHRLFEPLVERSEIGFTAISDLAKQFLASDTATASRLAMMISAPCAFVISEGGRVRYASRSKSLRDSNAWIPPQALLPPQSLSARLRSGELSDRVENIAADLWFNDWSRGGVLLEEARHLSQWDQTLTLLWFEDEEVPPERLDRDREDERGLDELDGILPWPGKRRRR